MSSFTDHKIFAKIVTFYQNSFNIILYSHYSSFMYTDKILVRYKISSLVHQNFSRYSSSSVLIVMTIIPERKVNLFIATNSFNVYDYFREINF